MQTALIVDSNCDLPPSVIDNHNIVVIPTNLTINGEQYLDYRNAVDNNLLYRSDRLNKKISAKSEAASEAIIQQILTEKIVGKFDAAVVQTMSRKHSLFYERMEKVISKMGHMSDVKFRVQDSKSVFTGQAVLAAHSAALIKKNVTGADLRKKIDQITPFLHQYSVPKDITYLRERASQRGEKSVSIVGAAIGKALGIVPIIKAYQSEVSSVKTIRGWNEAVNVLFNTAIAQIKLGLKSPFICISYAGESDIIKSLDGYHHLVAIAKQHNVHVLHSQMGIGGGINVGPETLSIAFAASPHKLTD